MIQKHQYIFRALYTLGFFTIFITALLGGFDNPSDSNQMVIIGIASLLNTLISFLSIIFKIPLFSCRDWFEKGDFKLVDKFGLVISIVLFWECK